MRHGGGRVTTDGPARGGQAQIHTDGQEPKLLPYGLRLAVQTTAAAIMSPLSSRYELGVRARLRDRQTSPLQPLDMQGDGLSHQAQSLSLGLPNCRAAGKVGYVRTKARFTLLYHHEIAHWPFARWAGAPLPSLCG